MCLHGQASKLVTGLLLHKHNGFSSRSAGTLLAWLGMTTPHKFEDSQEIPLEGMAIVQNLPEASQRCLTYPSRPLGT